MNKKGNILDMFYTLPIVILIGFVLAFTGAKVINGFTTAYGSANLNPTLLSQATANNNNTIASLNYFPIIIIGVGIIGILFIASYINTSGGLLFFVIIIFAMLAGSAFLYSNIIDSSIPDASFSLEKTQMAEATNSITYLPFMLIGGGVLLLVVMYGRFRQPV